MRRQFRRGETAETALTSAHAAPGDRLEAIDLGRAEILAQRLAQFAGRNAFAAAHHHAVVERMNRGGRPREGLRKATLKPVQPCGAPTEFGAVRAGGLDA